MRSTQFQLNLDKGRFAHVYAWLPAGEPRACLQIIHGMAEHAGRYARLAKVLTDAGYAVYAQDLPGHGRSVRSADELGHTSDYGGWRITLSAINSVRGEIVAHSTNGTRARRAPIQAAEILELSAVVPAGRVREAIAYIEQHGKAKK